MVSNRWGKTEAYLALTAFEITHRRLVFRDAGAGTSVMMRYTLRLLTSQQFERASRLISVLEWMRTSTLETNDYGLGSQRISLGMWVGGATTPNRLTSDTETNPGMVQILEQILDQEEPESPLQLLSCPCCGTRIIPGTRSSDRNDYGFDASPSKFWMWCPDENCLLSKKE